MVTVLSVHGLAGEVREMSETKEVLAAQTLQKSLIGHFAKSFEKAIQNEVDFYNQNRLGRDFIKKATAGLDPDDVQYILGLQQENIQLMLPALLLVKGKYTAVVQGVSLSFGPEEILRGQILIAGKAFTIHPSKTMREMRGDLEAFIVEQKIVENQDTDNAILRIVTSFFGISRAEALVPILVIAVVVLIAALGVGFWMKSKRAKLSAVKEALRQADLDMAKKAEACEQSFESDASYDTTFDLMGTILARKTESTAAGAFYATMLNDSDNGNSSEHCQSIVNNFVQRTLGGTSTAAGDTSEIGELRLQLCGGSGVQQILLGEGEHTGNFARLKNCLAQFHRAHQQITDSNRDSSYIDSESGLLRNRSYYNRSIGR